MDRDPLTLRDIVTAFIAALVIAPVAYVFIVFWLTVGNAS